MLPTVTDLFAQYPWLVAVVAVVMRAGLAYQRELSWYEYRTLHGLRRMVFPVLQRRVPVVSFVNEKGGRIDAEYLTTRTATVKATAKTLRQAGGTLHLLSSLKRRPPDHGDPLSRAHVTFLHDDGSQTEAFLFANDDGTTDVYAHHEPAPDRPAEHLGGDEQTDGDPRGVVTAALEA